MDIVTADTRSRTEDCVLHMRRPFYLSESRTKIQFVPHREHNLSVNAVQGDNGCLFLVSCRTLHALFGQNVEVSLFNLAVCIVTTAPQFFLTPSRIPARLDRSVTVVTNLPAERPTNRLMIYCLPRSITRPAEHSDYSQALVLRPSCVPEKVGINKKIIYPAEVME